MIIPGTVTPAINNTRPDVDPNLTSREEQIIKSLCKCRAAYRSSLEHFWSHQLKGTKKIQALLHFGVLWSYKMGDKEIVTLSPITRRSFFGIEYVPRDTHEVLKTVLAAELYLRVLGNVPCEFEPSEHPITQGILTVNHSPAGIMVILRSDVDYIGMKNRCLVICEDEKHIQETLKVITFPALFITQGDLMNREKDISQAFFAYNNGVLERKTISSYAPSNNDNNGHVPATQET
jgi:hypothetical protein